MTIHILSDVFFVMASVVMQSVIMLSVEAPVVGIVSILLELTLDNSRHDRSFAGTEQLTFITNNLFCSTLTIHSSHRY